MFYDCFFAALVLWAGEPGMGLRPYSPQGELLEVHCGQVVHCGLLQSSEPDALTSGTFRAAPL